ncbi:MAG: hypothetical protein A3F84_21090 [Candidatus Handelsmanbacteria bacterium RIFCSPLOWO2_12_FULL_64_10]|uniref:Uncharacterized protein n=1 Tax=Handelsmanbacteria sp. (strain RIFCSPLOWO2_12_FULL_64_10) TaxID=1817868 RepID=A0A1F6CCP2_HANXR|nr:MAG: hypothetical protein A3F84_21090 [Candidatus Handelsmanbacteria bacterium RIFCSPLOWO2_12_FULL_64_10]
MLSIFAIDPQVCQNLEWFRYCVEHCHPSRGRAIADLPPGEWCRAALGVIEQGVRESRLGSVMGQSLKRRLDMARDRLVHRPGTVWDYMEPSWVRNVEQEHRRERFAAVVSPEYREADEADRKYHPEKLDESVTAWNTPSGIGIQRSPDAFARAILPMLRVAKEIHFLDPHFKVDANSLFTRNYRQIIRDLTSQCEVFPMFTIHCCPDDDVKLTYFEGEFKRIYEELIPSGKSLTCVLWQVVGVPERGAHPFHNRFVLTDYCGVLVGYGTDSANAATEAPDTLQCLDQAIWHEKLTHSRKRTHPMVTIRKEIKITGR